VTGGASGIGRAMAELFARERAKVVLADIDERALAAVVESIRTRGGEALGVTTDVTSLETLAKDLRPYRIGVSVLCPMGVATQIRESARNRPPDLANEAPSVSEPVELMGRTLAPAAVAEMVLAAIRANRLYVITHEEALEALRRRHERLEQALLETKA